MKRNLCVICLIQVAVALAAGGQDEPKRATTAPSLELSENWIEKGLRAEAGSLALDPAATKWKDVTHIPKIMEDSGVREGNTYPHAGLLAQRMEQEGFLTDSKTAEGPEGSTYTPELAEAVRKYQEAKKIGVDGVFGPGTWESLEGGPAQKLRSIQINLARAQQLPERLGDRYILVNIPSGKLYVVDEGQLHSSMRVIYGEAAPGKQTPVLSDMLQYVVFNPYWNVPTSIVTKEIAPKVKENPDYLKRENFEVADGFSSSGGLDFNEANLVKISSGDLSLRQKPGPNNPLGQVKFIFPNEYSVYLHDTPKGSLFSENQRGFSHGCIRVENARKLCELVLGWDSGQVDEAMEGDKEKKVNLDNAIPIYITYFTAMPDPSKKGEVLIFEDVYQKDIDT